MKNVPRKPTGTVGCIQIFGDSRPPEFQQVEFPPEKPAIERKLVSMAVVPSNSLGKFYGLKAAPRQNAENELDFTLTTKDGEESLELMEVAVLGKGPYESAPLSYNHGELADAICAGIAKKSAKYGPSSGSGIHLLLYSTDFRFAVSPNVLWLVAKWCATQTHAFKSVVYIMFLSGNSIDAKIVHPQPKERFSGFDEKAVRGRRSILADITRMEALPDGSGVSLPLGRWPKTSKDVTPG